MENWIKKNQYMLGVGFIFLIGSSIVYQCVATPKELRGGVMQKIDYFLVSRDSKFSDIDENFILLSKEIDELKNKVETMREETLKKKKYFFGIF